METFLAIGNQLLFLRNSVPSVKPKMSMNVNTNVINNLINYLWDICSNDIDYYSKMQHANNSSDTD